MLWAYTATMMGSVVLNSTNFPDANFRAFVSRSTGVAEGGTISDAVIADQNYWNGYGAGGSLAYQNIQNMKGIEHFTSLVSLRCNGNQLTSLDLSALTKLQNVDCSNNQLTSLTLGAASSLNSVECQKNQLTSLNVSALTNLWTLNCSNNQLTSLDLSKNAKLITVECYNNKLATLTLGNHTNLTSLYCESNQLTSLNLNGCPALEILECGINQLVTLDVADLTALKRINCKMNRIQNLNVSKLSRLESLQCYTNQIAELNLSNCTELITLQCSGNRLSVLDVSHNTALTKIEAGNNQLLCLDASMLAALTSFSGQDQHASMVATQVTRNGETKYQIAMPSYFVHNSSKGTYVSKLGYGASEVEVVDGVTYLYADALQDFQYEYSVGKGSNVLKVTVTPVLEAPITDVVLNATNFPDAEFRAYITKCTGVQEGGILSDRILAGVVNMRDNGLKGRPVKNLKGIEYFYNLAVIDCSGCQITSLDLSQNKKVTEVMCMNTPVASIVLPSSVHNLLVDHGNLAALDVTNCPELVFMTCSDNHLTSLDITKNPKLYSIDACTNHLTSLDVTKNPLLKTIFVTENDLSSIDVSKNTILKTLEVGVNRLTKLDVSNNTTLDYLGCHDNNLTELDVTKNTGLTTLVCFNNRLTSLDVTKNTAITHLGCDGNELTDIDLSKNTELETLFVDYNYFTTLNLSANRKLKKLVGDHNFLESLDLSHNTALEYVDVNTNHLMSLDATMLNALTYFNGEEQTVTRPYERKAQMGGKRGFAVEMPFASRSTGAHVESCSPGVTFTTDLLGGTTTFYVDDEVAFNYTFAVRPGSTGGTGTAVKEANGTMHLDVLVSPSNSFIPGDVNMDGVLDVADINAMVSKILGQDPQPFNPDAADMNGDGNYDVTDLNAIIRLILE